MTDDALYLRHILECIANIEDDIADGRDVFMNDRRRRDAVMRNLHLLAESTTRLTEALQVQFPDVEWAQLRKFRHVAVHDYIGVDFDLIWLIVTSHVPRLKSQIQQIAATL